MVESPELSAANSPDNSESSAMSIPDISSKTRSLLNPVLIGAFSLFVPILFYLQAEEIDLKEKESAKNLRIKDSITNLRIIDDYKRKSTIDRLLIENEFYQMKVDFLEKYITSPPTVVGNGGQNNASSIEALRIKLDGIAEDNDRNYQNLKDELQKPRNGGTPAGSNTPAGGTTNNDPFYNSLVQRLETFDRNATANNINTGRKIDSLSTVNTKTINSINEALRILNERNTELSKNIQAQDTKINALTQLNSEKNFAVTDALTSCTELKLKIAALKQKVEALKKNAASLQFLKAAYDVEGKSSDVTVFDYQAYIKLSDLEKSILKTDFQELPKNRFKERIAFLDQIILQEIAGINAQIEGLSVP